MKHIAIAAGIFALCSGSQAFAGANSSDSVMIRKMADQILEQGACYSNLRVLCKQVGHRLSGSPEAEKAVQWGLKTMKEAGADSVWLQEIKVPNWKRGPITLSFTSGAEKFTLAPLALGFSVGTDGKTIEAAVIEVSDWEEIKQLGEQGLLKDKIVFINHRFNLKNINTFFSYGDCAGYRVRGASDVSRYGAKAMLLRSVSTSTDGHAHTGMMMYNDSLPKIPAIALSLKDADLLSQKLRLRMPLKMQLKADCKILPDATSYNVVGEIKGSEKPEEILTVGGHLDSWDVGEGAHDDGAGCVQSIEVLHTFKAMNIRPKRTIRAVLFMNEENGARGGRKYAELAKKNGEKHIAAMESDAGGFSPRGVGLEMSEAQKTSVRQWRHLLLPYGVYDFELEEGGVDISFLRKDLNTPLLGLLPDSQRYFDVHHSANDVFEAVNERELKLGALTMTAMMYLLSEYGL